MWDSPTFVWKKLFDSSLCTQVYELTSHDTPHCFKRNVWHVRHRTTAWHSKAYTVLPRPNFSALGLGFLDISTKSCFAKWQHIQRRMGRMTAVRWKCHLDQHHHHRHRHRHRHHRCRNLSFAIWQWKLRVLKLIILSKCVCERSLWI